MTNALAHSRHSCRAFSLTEVVVVLVLLTFGMSYTLVLAQETDDRAKLIQCLMNLRSIGMAMQNYANDNNGNLPRTVYDVSKTDKPVAFTAAGPGDGDIFNGKTVPINDVTAPLVHLMRVYTKFTPKDLICPFTTDVPDTFDGKSMNQWCNFRSSKSLSYSIANPYPSLEAVNNGYLWTTQSRGAEFAMAADMNPGIPELLTVQYEDSGKKQRSINSKNHGQSGQNILYGDGHCERRATAFAGIFNDNIYTFGKGDAQGIIGSPVDMNDTIMLPTETMR